jgi:hypothetical protein
MSLAMSPERITDDIGIPNHPEEADFFNQLILDLKKQLLGIKPDETITMERLEKATQFVFALDKCRRPLRVF